jgi:hypothetical protein
VQPADRKFVRFPYQPMNRLPTVRSGLLSHALDGQVLVYDTTGDRVHLLDPTTATVLELLQTGEWNYSALSAEIARRLGTPSGEQILELSINELHEAGLLDETIDKVAALPDVNRRELIRTLAAAGVAAVAIPTIASLTATIAAAQAGQSFRGTGQACGGAAVCAAALTCCGGICQDGQCNGTSCSSNGQCFSGLCCATTGNTCEPTCPAAGDACAACSSGFQCASGTCGGGGSCNPQTVPGGHPSNFSGTIAVANCGNSAAAILIRQNAANAQCCSGSATLGSCDNGSTQSYTCN